MTSFADEETPLLRGSSVDGHKGSTVTFHHVSYTVQVSKPGKPCSKYGKEILHGVRLVVFLKHFYEYLINDSYIFGKLVMPIQKIAIWRILDPHLNCTYICLLKEQTMWSNP